jgi:hypothetical protein
MSWQTSRVTALKLPSLPFALEPTGSPPPSARVRHGVLTLTAAASTDLFVDPAGTDPGQVPDAGAAWAFHASTDGAWWRLLRYFALSSDPAEMIRVGFLAQSPTGEGCAATFAFPLRDAHRAFH